MWLLLKSLRNILVQRGEGLSRGQGEKGSPWRWEVYPKP